MGVEGIAVVEAMERSGYPASTVFRRAVGKYVEWMCAAALATRRSLLSV